MSISSITPYVTWWRKGTIALKYCPTDDMTADTLTKPLDRIKFNKHREGMSVGRNLD